MKMKQFFKKIWEAYVECCYDQLEIQRHKTGINKLTVGSIEKPV